MVTVQKIGSSMNREVLEISGLSTDDKPTIFADGAYITNGSTFEEIDTGNVYKYNEDNKQWIEQPKSTGGASGEISLDYVALTNKPQISGVELSGNKTLDDLGIQPKGNYLTQENAPTVPEWAKQPNKPTYTADEVGAEQSGTAEQKVLTHDLSPSSHNDIRLLINELTSRINAVIDSDDSTLDQLSEIVSYIKNNKSIIESVTTTKVNISDIINNLTTNISTKVLSAAQGVELKRLIDSIKTNDIEYIEKIIEYTPKEGESGSKIYFTKEEFPSISKIKNGFYIIVNYKDNTIATPTWCNVCVCTKEQEYKVGNMVVGKIMAGYTVCTKMKNNMWSSDYGSTNNNAIPFDKKNINLKSFKPESYVEKPGDSDKSLMNPVILGDIEKIALSSFDNYIGRIYKVYVYAF